MSDAPQSTDRKILLRYIGYYLLVALAVVTLMLFLLNDFRRNEVELAYRQQETMAKASAGGIENYIGLFVQILDYYGSRPEFRNDTLKMHQIAAEIYNAHVVNLRSVSIVDSLGRLSYTFPEVPGTIGRDLTSQPHILEIMRNNRMIVSRPFQTVQGYKAIAIEVPLRTEGPFAGALAVLFEIGTLADVISSMVNIPPSSEVLIFDQFGSCLFHSAGRWEGMAMKNLGTGDEEYHRMTTEMLAGHSGRAAFRAGFDSAPALYYARYQPIRVGPVTWSLVIWTPERAIMGRIRRLALSFFLGGLVLLLIAALLFFRFYRADRRLLEARLRERVIEDTERDTQRRLEEVRNTKATYESIFESVSDAVFQTDADWTFRLVNPSATTDFGYTRAEELIGRRLSDLFADPQAFENFKDSLYRQTYLRNSIVRLRRTDGAELFLELSCRLVRDDQGRVTGFEGSGRNITRRIALEKQLTEYTTNLEGIIRQRTHELLESELRYKYLFENANDAILLETLDGYVLECNQKACQLLGYSQNELIGMHVSALVSPEIRTRLPVISKEILDAPGIMMETQNLRKDGVAVEVEVSLRGITLEGRDLALVFVRDITERKRFDRGMFQLQKMEAIASLAAGIAHDFNNILTILGNNLTMFERKSSVTAENERYFRNLHAALDRAKGITGQLLAHFRLSNETGTVTQLQESILEATRLLSPTLPKNINLQTSLPEEKVFIRTDPASLSQILVNLMINARDAMPRGGLLEVGAKVHEITAEQVSPHPKALPGIWASITVRDEGTGIDSAVQEHIFEPFFTTKEAGKGTGLGLYVVYSLVNRLGGYIELESTFGAGTTFTVHLPATLEGPPVAPPLSTTKEAEPVLRTHGSVLIVDDEEGIRTLARELLEMIGFRCTEAADGTSALQIYREQGPFDLVMLDIVMPGMDGLAVLSNILAIQPLQRVMIVTAHSLDPTLEGMLVPGRIELLLKPYHVSELEDALQRALK